MVYTICQTLTLLRAETADTRYVSGIGLIRFSTAFKDSSTFAVEAAFSVTLMTTDPERRNDVRLKVNIRSLLFLTTGIAALCKLYRSVPFGSLAVPIVVYFLAWVVPGASIGFDNWPCRKGLIVGGIVGAVLGGLILL
jgi:hypothetical protein